MDNANITETKLSVPASTEKGRVCVQTASTKERAMAIGWYGKPS
jgi:hypothetical protein